MAIDIPELAHRIAELLAFAIGHGVLDAIAGSLSLLDAIVFLGTFAIFVGLAAATMEGSVLASLLLTTAGVILWGINTLDDKNDPDGKYYMFE